MVIVKEVTIVFQYFFMLYNILSECIILGNSISFLTLSFLLVQIKAIDNYKFIFLLLNLKWNCICYLYFWLIHLNSFNLIGCNVSCHK